MESGLIWGGNLGGHSMVRYEVGLPGLRGGFQFSLQSEQSLGASQGRKKYSSCRFLVFGVEEKKG